MSSTAPSDGDSGGAGGSKSATARALFASPRLLHSSSLPTGTVFAPVVPDAETDTAFSMSPTSVLDAAASFRSGPDAVGSGSSRRRPWRGNALHGLADVLDCGDHQQPEGIVLAATSPSLLVRSCSLDRRVEFGVKNKSSWLPLRASSGREATPRLVRLGLPLTGHLYFSLDYTCVISRGPNPRTVHIFGDRVVEAGAAESSPRPINLPARGDRGFLSL